MNKCIVQFKDGSYCNLVADLIINGEDGYVQVWNDQRMVGIFLLTETKAIYTTEKKGGDT